MRKLIMWNMLTLDGLFEGSKPWELDWHDYVWGEELERWSLEQLQTAGALLFGRVTYQGMADYWSKANDETATFMNGLPKYVFSRTLEKADWKNTTLIKDKAEDEVRKLKEQDGKDLFVFGSAIFSSSLMRAGLFDEYRLGMNPLVLGGGTSLFKPSPTRLKMKLLEALPMKSGLVLLRYEPERQ